MKVERRGGYKAHDADSGATEAPSTASGSDEEAPDGKRAGGCCSVNVTTTFVPHTVKRRTGNHCCHDYSRLVQPKNNENVKRLCWCKDLVNGESAPAILSELSRSALPTAPSTRSSDLPQRGILDVFPSRLRLSPPSLVDLNHWRDITGLRDRTDPETVESESSGGQVAPRGESAATATTTTAFIRWRVLPSGVWEFSRTFQLSLPRPADWGRDPSGAG